MMGNGFRESIFARVPTGSYLSIFLIDDLNIFARVDIPFPEAVLLLHVLFSQIFEGYDAFSICCFGA